jgi:hypothetical protein
MRSGITNGIGSDKMIPKMPDSKIMFVANIIISYFVLSSSAFADDTGSGCIVPPTIDCTSKRDCTPPHDTRECNRCIMSIFGHCSVHSNDPTCEASKASQNQIYITQKALCEEQKEQDRIDCELVKTKLIAAAAAACAGRN